MNTMNKNTVKDYCEARQTNFTVREALWAVLDLRGRLAWALGDLGNAVARLGHRLDDDVPTTHDAMAFYLEGYERGRADRTG